MAQLIKFGNNMSTKILLARKRDRKRFESNLENIKWLSIRK